MEPYIIIECPYCKNQIQIYKNEINCAIFRHGTFKYTGLEINPHSSKEECDNYLKNDLIYGCGKPFRIIIENGEYKAKNCDYI
jgi:hypothetical protein